MLEATDFPQALQESKHNARQVMSQCNWSGAERRAPINVWSEGMCKMTPGASYPGKDAASYASGRDTNKCFLTLHREANEELAKAIAQGRRELQQEHDSTPGHKAHPRQPPLPPHPGNSHASAPDANTNACAGAQPNSGQDRPRDSNTGSAPMDTSGATIHCTAPNSTAGKRQSGGATNFFDMSATDEEVPPQPQANGDEMSQEPATQDVTGHTKAGKRKHKPNQRSVAKKQGSRTVKAARPFLPIFTTLRLLDRQASNANNSSTLKHEEEPPRATTIPPRKTYHAVDPPPAQRRRTPLHHFAWRAFTETTATFSRLRTHKTGAPKQSDTPYR